MAESFTCPICGEESETIYFGAEGSIIGCDCCVTSQDVGEFLEELREIQEAAEADRRVEDAKIRRDPGWV